MTEVAPTPTPISAPALFIGIQPGFGEAASIELYVLLSPVGHHPIGSTVSRQTLERHGYNLFVDHRAHDAGSALDRKQPVLVTSSAKA